MFERFTPDARELVLEAQVQRRVTHDQKVRTEHLLLALLADSGPSGEVLRRQGLRADRIVTRLDDPDSRADPATAEDDDQLLKGLGIDVDAIRRSVDQTIGPGALDRARGRRGRAARQPKPLEPDDAGRNSRFDERSKRVLELSLREALRLKSKHIGPEHIALGLLREGHGGAYRLLVDEAVDLAELRASWEAIAWRSRNRRPRGLVQRLRG